MELLPNIGSERVTKLTEHGQGTVKNNQHADSPEELPQKFTPVFTIHRSTFGTLYDILLIGSRNLIEKPAAKQHNRVYQQTGGKRHPIFRHMQIIHHELSQGFHQTGRDYQSNAQPDIQYFTDTTSFDIAKNDTPDHTQGKTAQKNRTHLQRNRKKCKTQQSNFGKSKQPYYIIDAVTRFHRRQNTNTDELGKGVADNLRKDIQDFDIESPKNLTFINGCGKWLTVGIGTSINQKNQNAGIESQNVKGRTGKKGTNHSCSSLYGYGLASKLFKLSAISFSAFKSSRLLQLSMIVCASFANSSSNTSP